MYAPVYCPPAPPPSAAVRAAERAILDQEGPYHIAGQYVASEADANRARRVEAERRVRAAEREAHRAEPGRAA